MTLRRQLYALVGCLLCAAPASADDLALTLDEAIGLALSKSRAAISARLGREDRATAVEAAEERYEPRIALTSGLSAREEQDPAADVGVGVSLRVPTGGTFRLAWRKPVAGEGEREGSADLSFTQPLLKGFGPDIDTQQLRRARLQERIDRLAFRDAAAGIVDSVVGAYRGVLRAASRLAIAREALERARRQLEINQALVEAGRMAPQDLVQTESDVADKEFALIDAENALENANYGLVNTLDLEEGVRIEVQAELPVQPERPDLEASLATAFARRTDWLRAETGVVLAGMALLAAEDELLPALALTGRMSRAGGVGETDWSTGLDLTVQLQDDAPRRALARARNAVTQARMQLAERRQSIRISVRRAVHNVGVALRQIDLAARARALAERKLDIERRKLQQGLSSAFQVGRFEDDLVGAQRRELDAEVGYRNALTSLDRMLGTTLDRWGIAVERVGR